VTRNGGRTEPLFAVYRTGVLPLVEQRLARGERSLQGLIGAGRFAHVAVPPAVAPSLANANTPGELAAILGQKSAGPPPFPDPPDDEAPSPPMVQKP
jgi:molybdopterin-guanine dinucleotide biosynthesis protein A